VNRRTLRRWSGPAALACVLAILALTLTPLGAGPHGTALGICLFGLPCWLGHFATFAALGVALAGWYATSEVAARSPQRVLVMLLLALWLFAALDEFAQSQVGRDAEFGDWAMDMAGALLGLLGGSALLRAATRR
jgi:hypothetical protein